MKISQTAGETREIKRIKPRNSSALQEIPRSKAPDSQVPDRIKRSHALTGEPAVPGEAGLPGLPFS